MLELLDYQIIENIYQGRNSFIYHGIKKDQHYPVIIKVSTKPGFVEAAKLQNEWEMRQHVISEHVVKYLEIKIDPTYGKVLIEEDDQSEVLTKHIPATGFEISAFLNIALQLVQGLQDIHQCKIIHNDIKPSNIILQPNTGKVKYIDFGSASYFYQSKQGIINPFVSGGTLAYLSPEQTGRINRMVDYRTDFYSLGMTFYQLLCGQLPFNTTDPLQLIHCQIAKQPIVLHELKLHIPKPLSDIVMKLLSKDAEDRYQSAHGIYMDLKKCAVDLETKAEIFPFILAEHDFPERFYVPQKLYGREQELALIVQAFQRVANQESKSEVVAITGAAGIGKSAMVKEIQPIIVAKKGLFLEGKFEKTTHKIVYSALSQAFQNWVKQILIMSNEEELQIWKQKLLAVLGNNGQVLVDVIPNLEWIIGKQALVSNLDAVQAKNRFQLIFQNFISVLVQPNHPLVLFLDDWQWADVASLDLIEACFTKLDIQNILFIGAYRDKEVDALHPALQSLAAIQKVGVAVQTITLASLPETSVNQWVAEAMHSSLEITRSLTTLLYQKTAGNPFFIRIFLQGLCEQQLPKLIKEGKQWNVHEIYQLPTIENAIEFMIHQIQQIPEKARDILKLASCLGHRFKVDILQQIAKATQEKVVTELQVLVDNGFLIRIEEDFQFTHDRVQETAYSLISNEELAPLHLSIGRLLQAKLAPEPNPEQLFEVVNHFNQGEIYIIDQHEWLLAVTLNFDASKKAKNATAYPAALHYLQIAKNLLEKIDGWLTQYPLTYSVHKELAELEFLNGNAKQSEVVIYLLISHVHSVLEKVEIYNLLIVQKNLAGQYQNSIELGNSALELLGIQLPKENLPKVFEDGRKEILHYLLVRFAIENFADIEKLDKLLDMPLLNIAEQQLVLKVLDNIIPATYCTNSELHPVIIVMMINLSLVYGYTIETCSAYSLYAQVLCSKLHDYQTGYAFGQLAIKLSDKLNNSVARCRSRSLFLPFTLHWTKHLSEADPILEAGYQAGLESGDFLHLGYLYSTKARILFHRGEPLTQLANELTTLINFPNKSNNQVAIQQIKSIQIIVTNLMGTSAQEKKMDFSYDSISDNQYQQIWQQQQDNLTLCHYGIYKAYVFYLYGSLELARETLLSIEKLLNFAQGEIETVIYNYIDSLILVALYPAASDELQQQYKKQLEINQEQMKIWAEHCPANFQHKYLLISAEIKRVQGKNWEDWEIAIHQYDQAIREAQQQGYIQDQALASELGAKFWLANQMPFCAKTYLYEAYNSYSRWGAKRKLAMLTSQYPDLLTAAYQPHLSSFSLSSNNSIKGSSLTLIDLTSVLKASQTISSEIELSKLLMKMMQVIVENAGAQTGAFWLEEAGTLWLQADYSAEGQFQILQKLPLMYWEKGSRSLIKYVERTQQPVLLEDASDDSEFSQDPYIKAHHVKSVLCIPVIRKKQLKGILYLENNLLSHAFTKQHQQILTILASQMAISLENALLFEFTRKMTDRLNLSLQSGNVGTWSWNIRENKVSWGEAMYTLFGMTKEDFGQNYESVIAMIHPEDRMPVEEAIKRTLTENAPYNLEYRIISPHDNSIHFIISKGKVYYNEEGQPEYIVGIAWDVTQRKRLEEERFQALQQAEQREHQRAKQEEKHRKELEEFIDTVCHEMRNPMSGIWGTARYFTY